MKILIGLSGWCRIDRNLVRVTVVGISEDGLLTVANSCGDKHTVCLEQFSELMTVAALQTSYTVKVRDLGDFTRWEDKTETFGFVLDGDPTMQRIADELLGIVDDLQGRNIIEVRWAVNGGGQGHYASPEQLGRIAWRR